MFPDDRLDTRDIEQHVNGWAKDQQFQTITYILKGGVTETRRPRLTYGFQYVPAGRRWPRCVEFSPIRRLRWPLAEQIKKTFNDQFFRADTGSYGNGKIFTLL